MFSSSSFKHDIFNVPLGCTVAFTASICLFFWYLRACVEPRRASARRGEAHHVVYILKMTVAVVVAHVYVLLHAHITPTHVHSLMDRIVKWIGLLRADGDVEVPPMRQPREDQAYSVVLSIIR